MGWNGLRRQTGFEPLSVGVVATASIAPAWFRICRFTASRHAAVFFIVLVVSWLAVVQLKLVPAQWSSSSLINIPGLNRSHKRMTTAYNTLPPLDKRVPCYGPRGRLLSESTDDSLEEVELTMPYPMPFSGSYEALGLDMTWVTAEGRYAAYGYGEEKNTYNRSRVDWDKVDWGKLQNDCLARNRHRFPFPTKFFEDTRSTVRFGYRNESRIPEVRHWHEFNQTRRTAIIVRAWKGYEYGPEDRHYLRSLITETALKTGGEYQVILLVDMRESEENIFASDEGYKLGFKNSGVPPEFESITVLWDDHLLKSWYPKIEEHRTMWQVYQPMQLFALHYPDFDHVWQFELDMRFTGDAGKFLDRMSDFARREPRKQALERATFQHMQQQIGDYNQFKRAVDRANEGGAYIWGPLRVPEISPIGPEPPTRSAHDDDFQWGVGEDADVIVTSFCNNASAADTWVFRDWLHGFRAGLDTPRFFCPPAITRTSRALLLVIHQAQLDHGIRVPSEATPPSFALWHGLKLSFPQHPVFWKVHDDFNYQGEWWKGGPINSSSGVGPDSLAHPRGIGLTFWWESDWARRIFDAWQGYPLGEGVAFPWLLARHDDKVYVPNMMVHPMKHRLPPSRT